jgi:hypothetical protein
MTFIKRSGEPPAYATALRREIRTDLREHNHGQLGQAIGEAKNKLEADAMQELASMPDVRSLSDREYRSAKRRAIQLTGRAERPRP